MPRPRSATASRAQRCVFGRTSSGGARGRCVTFGDRAGRWGRGAWGELTSQRRTHAADHVGPDAGARRAAGAGRRGRGGRSAHLATPHPRDLGPALLHELVHRCSLSCDSLASRLGQLGRGSFTRGLKCPAGSGVTAERAGLAR